MQASQYAKCCDSILCNKLLQQDWFRRRRRGIDKLEANRVLLEKLSEDKENNPSDNSLTVDEGFKRESDRVLKLHALHNKSHGNVSRVSKDATRMEPEHFEMYLRENYFMFQ